MNPESTSNLVRYIHGDSSIVCLTFDKKGIILDSNSFADTLSGKSLIGHPLTDFFIDFGGSGASNGNSFDLSQTLLINLVTSSGMPETFYFRFYDEGDRTLALGEANSREIAMLRSNLLELNKELNNLTRDLHKKNAELCKLNELKNEFLGIAAHDLRNPIGIIMAYSNFLLEELDTELTIEQIQMLHTIENTSEFMLQLLNNLLDITAIESGKLNLDLQLYDIVSLLSKNVALNSVIAARKNIRIHVESYEQLPKIMIDSSKIEQVLNNLISNAIKFSMPGTTIRVSSFLSGSNVTIAVADQGQGIPSGELDRLFNPFQRTSVRTTAGEKSTGLGLSIVRNIIMGHRGKIWVESTVGAGSTFYFSLPIKKTTT